MFYALTGETGYLQVADANSRQGIDDSIHIHLKLLLGASLLLLQLVERQHLPVLLPPDGFLLGFAALSGSSSNNIQPAATHAAATHTHGDARSSSHQAVK